MQNKYQLFLAALSTDKCSRVLRRWLIVNFVIFVICFVAITMGLDGSSMEDVLTVLGFIFAFTTTFSVSQILYIMKDLQNKHEDY